MLALLPSHTLEVTFLSGPTTEKHTRLVVPGDKRGGRYVSGVVRVRIDRGR